MSLSRKYRRHHKDNQASLSRNKDKQFFNKMNWLFIGMACLILLGLFLTLYFSADVSPESLECMEFMDQMVR